MGENGLSVGDDGVKRAPAKLLAVALKSKAFLTDPQTKSAVIEVKDTPVNIYKVLSSTEAKQAYRVATVLIGKAVADRTESSAPSSELHHGWNGTHSTQAAGSACSRARRAQERTG